MNVKNIYVSRMAEEAALLARVRSAAERKVIFLPHAVKQMLKPKRMIGTAEVRMVIEQGEIIEMPLLSG